MCIRDRVEKGTELQVLSYEGTTDGVVDLYQVSYQGQTGYISGQYVSTVQEAVSYTHLDVYKRQFPAFFDPAVDGFAVDLLIRNVHKNLFYYASFASFHAT